VAVKIRSYFKVEVGGKTAVKVHNTLTPEYKYLLQGLLTQGQGYRAPYSNYSVSFQPPSNIYIVLLNQGTVVARLPAELSSYNEQINTVSTSSCQDNLTSCNLDSLTFQLEYGATDETDDSYTFDEIQIWADNLYAIAYANVKSVTKNPNTFIKVTWDATVTIESNGVLYIPGCTNFSFTFNAQVKLPNYQPFLCLNIPYIIVALTLVPYNLIPQNTFIYTQLSGLIDVLKARIPPHVGIPGSGSVPPAQLLDFQGVQYYVVAQSNGNTVYPITEPFALTNTQQSSTLTLFLLYGISDNYFIYTTALTVNVQYFKLYIPTLVINVIEE
jgi:hypothetical protein